jgi:hypothetical protein
MVPPPQVAEQLPAIHVPVKQASVLHVPPEAGLLSGSQVPPEQVGAPMVPPPQVTEQVPAVHVPV